jgi:hypothetical protein
MYSIRPTWLLPWRGQLSEDPIVCTLRDRVSWIVAALMIILLMVAI